MKRFMKIGVETHTKKYGNHFTSELTKQSTTYIEKLALQKNIKPVKPAGKSTREVYALENEVLIAFLNVLENKLFYIKNGRKFSEFAQLPVVEKMPIAFTEQIGFVYYPVSNTFYFAFKDNNRMEQLAKGEGELGKQIEKLIPGYRLRKTFADLENLNQEVIEVVSEQLDEWETSFNSKEGNTPQFREMLLQEAVSYWKTQQAKKEVAHWQ